MAKKIVIAIDGFSSCGKSTMAKDLAKEIGYIYIDSGAMYRAITLYAIQHNLFEGDVLNEQELKKAIGKIQVSFRLNAETGVADTYLNGVDVENEIRSMDVSKKVSIVSAVPFVRHELVRLQQEMGKSKGIVMDGRDIGTVVFPDAELKVFVTANTDVRAMRRLKELRAKGDFETTVDQVMENIKERDYRDQHRQESPLRKADDAILLDNSYLHKDEQKDWLLCKYDKAVHP